MVDVVQNVYGNFSEPVVWELDCATNRCRRCDRSWGLLFPRRHHCRCCGELVCADCSSSDVVTHDSKHLERVCFPCTSLIKAIQLELHHVSAFYDQMKKGQEEIKNSPPSKGSIIMRTVSGYLSSAELSRGKKCVRFEGDLPDASQNVILVSPRKFNTKLVFISSSLSQSTPDSPSSELGGTNLTQAQSPILVNLEVTLTPQALQLQKSLDEMTDFELEKLFKKLSASKALSGISQDDIQNYPELVFQEILANPGDYGV